MKRKWEAEWVEDERMAREVEKLEREVEQDKKTESLEEIAKKLSQSVPVAHMGAEHFTQPEQIFCKYCGSKDIMKYGIRNGVQNYICRKCGRKFTARDTPYYMRTPVEQIGASLGMYYDGLSLSDIVRQLDVTYHNPVDQSTVYRWLTKYTKEAIAMLEPLKPKVGDTWIADETALKFDKDLHWIWDVIDRDLPPKN